MFTWLKERFVYNNVRGVYALQTDNKHSHSTHTEVITTNKTDYAILTADADEHISIAGVQISVAGNVGEVKLDFENGTPVKRLYSSNKTQIASQNVSIHGTDGNNLIFIGDGSANDIFIAINYKKHNM